jgi:predicted TIM-barrel fold metal-dependent hydrolase
MLTDFLGPDHVMFGSDYPFWAPERSFAAVKDADLGDEAWSAISSGTATRVFGL